MTTWLISDTHFGHKRMIEEQWRPFDTVQKMNTSIMSKWNTVVKPGDRVYHLGDVTIGNSAAAKHHILPYLNGDIVYIKGNHDKKGIDNILFTYKGKKIELVHRPQDATFMADITIHGHIHATGKRDMGGIEDVVKVNDYIHICPETVFYNVNLEFHNYRPKSLNEIIGEIKTILIKNG